MISKRTAIILIIAIVAIAVFETNFGFDKMNETKENLDHTVAQITLMVDGETIDLEGLEVAYNYEKESLTATLSKISETGYENIQNNSVNFKPCAIGSNKLSFTIPEGLIPAYNSDLTINFGCENNESEFNNYSLVINLTTIDETSVNADVAQTVYYPDENGNALSKKAETSTVVSSENSTINCIIK